MTRQHDTVGWRFRFAGAVFRCIRWRRESGYDMKVLELGPDSTGIGPVGSVRSVSENAINRTYHQDFQEEEPAAHEPPCNCFVCEDR